MFDDIYLLVKNKEIKPFTREVIRCNVMAVLDKIERDEAGIMLPQNIFKKPKGILSSLKIHRERMGSPWRIQIHMPFKLLANCHYHLY